MRKGILLAGGNGSRLYPITKGVNKHLLQIYDKPMIYYPLSTLMLADVRDILLITNVSDIDTFKKLFGNGNYLGINIKYEVQEKPEGVAQAFIIAKDFIKDNPSILILGDNIFHGNQLIKQLKNIPDDNKGASVFAYPVKDPERYGVVEFDSQGKVLSIEEKPQIAKSKYALTGLYFFDSSVIEKSSKLKKSSRNEFEITSINKEYLDEGSLNVVKMGRGTAWLDAGTHDALHDASSYIKTLQQRQGLIIGCLEEISWRKGWITSRDLISIAKSLKNNFYKEYLFSLVENK